MKSSENATLNLIKRRSSTRRYSNRQIPNASLKLIIEGGLWGPAIHHFQPWKFIVVKDFQILEKVRNIILKKLREKDLPGFILYPTSVPLLEAKALIFVYNTGDFAEAVKRLRPHLANRVKIAEISAISAAIQNMVLVAESIGLGSCWLDAPLFCEKELQGVLGIKHELIAVLTLGYPLGSGVRSTRKPLREVFACLNKKMSIKK